MFRNPFNWYNKFGTIPSSYREAMSYEEQILWLCQQIENLKIGSANYNYNLLENKPSINGVTLEGNVTSAQLGLDLNYNFLMNKPSINGITLLGNKSLDDLGIQQKLVAGSGIRIIGNTISAIGGGSGGTSDYDDLENRPKINGITITGDKTAEDYDLSKVLITNHSIDETGYIFAISGLQTGSVVPQILDTMAIANSGNMTIYAKKDTLLSLYGNFDLYAVSQEDNIMGDVFTTQNTVMSAWHLCPTDEIIYINFFDLNTYTYSCEEIMRGQSIVGKIEDNTDKINCVKYDLDKLFSENFPITEITAQTVVSVTDYTFNVTPSSIGSPLPSREATTNGKYFIIPVDSHYASHLVIVGECLGKSMWFTTNSALEGKVILSASETNIEDDDYNVTYVDIPEGAESLYVQFTNTDEINPRIFAQKITSLAGAVVSHLSGNPLVLTNGIAPTLNTGLYVLDTPIYLGSIAPANLIYGTGDLIYFDSSNNTFYGTLCMTAYESNTWSIYQNEYIENTLTDSRNKIPTSHAVWEVAEAMANSLFYKTIGSTLVLALDGTNNQNLETGFYRTSGVQYYDSNGLNLATELSNNFCYYNATDKILSLTGIQRNGLVRYTCALIYEDSTNGWSLLDKQTADIVNKNSLATTITSSSTNTEAPSSLAVYNATLDNYSTTEQRVGTWIDGKPLYRKCYQLTNLPTANNYTDTSTGFIMSDIFPVKLEATLKSDWGAYFSCYSGNNNSYISSSLAVNDVQTNPVQIRIRSSLDIHTYVGYAILTYTKTTD